MGQLTVQELDDDGLEPDAGLESADGAGDTWENTGDEYLRVVNNGGSQVTVTVDSKQQCNFGFDHDVSVDVPAGEERLISPEDGFPPKRFGASPDISYTDVTDVEVGVYRI
ncbi:MAG: hypothetical protein ACOC5E_01925 [Acidobacteriota bacterium]